nr:hypothetical protein [Sphingomonas melonis]
MLVPILGSAEAALKIGGGAGGTVLREEGTTLIAGRPYVTDGGTIDADEIYYVNGLVSETAGPWLGEADKVVWRDPASGYECIMMRATEGGYLSGYVGVSRDHPLWGWKYEAIPAEFGIEVHGGLTYARICEEGPTPERRIVVEARRICHVPRKIRLGPATTHATSRRVEDAHLWWFGFDCDYGYDLAPDEGRHPRGRFLATEIGREYRDDAYVCREVRNLAAQLRAIADGGEVPPREGPPLPPVGLDPGAGDV